jgi:hypothetical protein
MGFALLFTLLCQLDHVTMFLVIDTHIDVPKFLKLLVFPVPYVACIVLPTLLKGC